MALRRFFLALTTLLLINMLFIYLCYLLTSYQNSQGAQNENDLNNTTIFVCNLDPNVMNEHLRQVFGQYGELVCVKIPSAMPWW
ncbi:hypothetical protein RIF29_38179 [Crotalaria pallida]|uniref:RRM domain-containing protein n=1 Tax=Crotalaria pallida TaxID=3830 RepID=A0AAN9DZ55_CROPI